MLAMVFVNCNGAGLLVMLVMVSINAVFVPPPKDVKVQRISAAHRVVVVVVVAVVVAVVVVKIS